MLKKIARVALVCAFVGAMFFVFPPRSLSASAENTNFQVNVKEILSVSVTTPDTWAEGDVGDFLRNKITVGVTSNNASGFTAGMTTSGSSTALAHSSKNTTIPTISAGDSYECTGSSDPDCSAFVADHWGYSLGDANLSGTYLPMVDSNSAPITILSGNSATSGSQDVYFGAKASIGQASGTYHGTVVISVVSGTNGSSLPAPSSGDPTPVGPNTDSDNPAHIGEAPNDVTTYTYTTTSGSGTTATTTTTTQVTPGDNTSAYEGYTPPQGATEVASSNVYEGSMLTTALATTAAVAAGTGIAFFILAKRKKDDDEDEEAETE